MSELGSKEFWQESYQLIRDCVLEHLDKFIIEDDIAEEAIICEAIESANEERMRGRNLAILIRQYEDAIVQHLPDDSLGAELWQTLYERAKLVAPEYWKEDNE